MQRLVLASGSPRRRELLTMMGVEFEVVESGFDEEKVKIDDPQELVQELAIQKAMSVARRYDEGVLVLGGDTLVDVNGVGVSKLLGKEQAREVMQKLSGKEHIVCSGVAVVSGGSLETDSLVAVSTVKFLDLSEEAIDRYVDSGAWKGYAGGYALQGKGGELIEGYSGKLSTIIGLPVSETTELLESRGIMVEVEPRDIEEMLTNSI